MTGDVFFFFENLFNFFFLQLFFTLTPPKNNKTKQTNKQPTKQKQHQLRAEITLLACAIPFHVALPAEAESQAAAQAAAAGTSGDPAAVAELAVQAAAQRPHLVSQAFPLQRAWPYLEELTTKWHAHPIVLEAVCECFQLLFDFLRPRDMAARAWGMYADVEC
jgi:hypothetical protein